MFTTEKAAETSKEDIAEATMEKVPEPNAGKRLETHDAARETGEHDVGMGGMADADGEVSETVTSKLSTLGASKRVISRGALDSLRVPAISKGRRSELHGRSGEEAAFTQANRSSESRKPAKKVHASVLGDTGCRKRKQTSVEGKPGQW